MGKDKIDLSSIDNACEGGHRSSSIEPNREPDANGRSSFLLKLAVANFYDHFTDLSEL